MGNKKRRWQPISSIDFYVLYKTIKASSFLRFFLNFLFVAVVVLCSFSCLQELNIWARSSGKGPLFLGVIEWSPAHYQRFCLRSIIRKVKVDSLLAFILARRNVQFGKDPTPLNKKNNPWVSIHFMDCLWFFYCVLYIGFGFFAFLTSCKDLYLPRTMQLERCI